MSEDIQELLEFKLKDFENHFYKLSPKDVKGENIVTIKILQKILNEFEISKTLEECQNILDKYGTIVSIEKFLMYMKKALSPTEFITLELIGKKEVTEDTSIFRFVLQSPEHICGHGIFDYIIAQEIVGEERIQRFYTPISNPTKKQWLDVCVKKKEGGKMSKHFHGMELNDMIEFKGPIKQIKFEPESFRKIIMIAGGTGVTPFLSLIRTTLINKKDKTRLTLLCSNKSEKDILFYNKLKRYSRDHRLSVYHILTKSKERSHFIKSRVTKTIVETFLPKPSRSALVLVCGPKGFNENVLKILKELEYPNINVFGYGEYEDGK